MNYYEAKQRERDGRFDFTRTNDGHTSPVGYCAPYCEYWKDSPMREDKQVDVFTRTYIAHKDQHHTDGHKTKEEAVECFRQYQIDHNVQLNHKDNSQQRKCAVCGDWTQLFATDNHSFMAHLCESHMNREEVEKLYPKSDQIISSY